MEKWKWADCEEPTHAELHPANYEVGEADSILYHGADWPIKPEHKALIAAAPQLLEACEGLTKLAKAMNDRQHTGMPISPHLWNQLYDETNKASGIIAKAKSGGNE